MASLPFTLYRQLCPGPHAGPPFVRARLFTGEASPAQHLCSLGISSPNPDALANFAFHREKKLCLVDNGVRRKESRTWSQICAASAFLPLQASCITSLSLRILI